MVPGALVPDLLILVSTREPGGLIFRVKSTAPDIPENHKLTYFREIKPDAKYVIMVVLKDQPPKKIVPKWLGRCHIMTPDIPTVYRGLRFMQINPRESCSYESLGSLALDLRIKKGTNPKTKVVIWW